MVSSLVDDMEHEEGARRTGTLEDSWNAINMSMGRSWEDLIGIP